MEKIISLSFNRFKKTFLRYFLVYVLSVLGFVGTFLAAAISAGVMVGLYFLLGQQMAVAIILGILLAVLIIGLFVYLTTWMQIAQTLVIIKPEIKSVIDSFKEAQPLIPGLIIFQIINGLFLAGLFLTNIFLFVPYLLWSIWGSFSLFYYIAGKRGGLTPLWYSRAKVNTNFFKVVGYYLIIVFAYFLIAGLVSQGGEELGFINTIFWFIASPLIISFSYELFQSLPEPKEVKAPKSWLLFSVLGWAVNALLIFGILSSGYRSLPKLLKQNKQLKIDQNLRQEILKNIENSKLN